MRYLLGFARFWRDFLIGDDWRLAAIVGLVLVGGAILVAAGVTGGWLPVALGLAVAGGFAAALLIEGARR